MPVHPRPYHRSKRVPPHEPGKFSWLTCAGALRVLDDTLPTPYEAESTHVRTVPLSLNPSQISMFTTMALQAFCFPIPCILSPDDSAQFQNVSPQDGDALPPSQPASTPRPTSCNIFNRRLAVRADHPLLRLAFISSDRITIPSPLALPLQNHSHRQPPLVSDQVRNRVLEP